MRKLIKIIGGWCVAAPLRPELLAASGVALVCMAAIVVIVVLCERDLRQIRNGGT